MSDLIAAVRAHVQAMQETMASPNTRARGQRIAKLLRELEAAADSAQGRAENHHLAP